IKIHRGGGGGGVGLAAAILNPTAGPVVTTSFVLSTSATRSWNVWSPSGEPAGIFTCTTNCSTAPGVKKRSGFPAIDSHGLDSGFDVTTSARAFIARPLLLVTVTVVSPWLPSRRTEFVGTVITNGLSIGISLLNVLVE